MLTPANVQELRKSKKEIVQIILRSWDDARSGMQIARELLIEETNKETPDPSDLKEWERMKNTEIGKYVQCEMILGNIYKLKEF
jgi:hypothetical protein